MVEELNILGGLASNLIEVVERFIPEEYRIYLGLVAFIVLATIYSIFTWKFHRFLAKRDILDLNLSKYNTSEQAAKFWINEPANCRWSQEDRDYGLMEQEMDCHTGIDDYDTSVGGWTCDTTLTDLANGNNQFYIRCQDNSENANNMSQSYPYILKKSSSGLVIDSISPESGKEIFTGTEPTTINLEVKTSGGAEQGKATCYYKFTTDNNYIKFKNTMASIHKQTFSSIVRGNYRIDVKCEDAAEDSVETATQFSVRIDTEPPKITRVYHSGASLIIMTDEDALCAYSLTDSECSFNVGNASSMTGSRKEHSTSWQTDKTYYVRCKDYYDRASGGCSIIVRPYKSR